VNQYGRKRAELRTFLVAHQWKKINNRKANVLSPAESCRVWRRFTREGGVLNGGDLVGPFGKLRKPLLVQESPVSWGILHPLGRERDEERSGKETALSRAQARRKSTYNSWGN